MSGNGSGVLKNRTKGVSTSGQRARKLIQRPEATQARAVTPPSMEAIRRSVEALMCPWCGRGPWKMLAGHTTRIHGIDRLELRDLAGLTYSTSISSPEVNARNTERGRENVERLHTAASLAKRKGTKRRFSKAGLAVQVAKLDASRSPEQRKAAAKARHTPEKDAAHSALMRAKGGEPEHGTQRMYRLRGCRCEVCRAGNTATHRAYLDSRKATDGSGSLW